MRRRIKAWRAKVTEILEREAKVRDLVKASLPLWISVVLACGVGIGVLSAQAQQRTDDAADNRAAACVQSNVEQQGDRDSALNGALVTFGFAPGGSMTAEDRERIVAALGPELQARYRAVEQQAAADNPFRDCTPEGIAEFYNHPPADPATTGG